MTASGARQLASLARSGKWASIVRQYLCGSIVIVPAFLDFFRVAVEEHVGHYAHPSFVRRMVTWTRRTSRQRNQQMRPTV